MTTSCIVSMEQWKYACNAFSIRFIISSERNWRTVVKRLTNRSVLKLEKKLFAYQLK